MMRGPHAPFGPTPAEQLSSAFLELLKRFGIERDVFPEPLRRLYQIDGQPFWAVPLGAQAVQIGGAFVAKLAGNPGLGLQLGVRVPVGARGIIDDLLRSASTPRHAIELSKRFQPLAFDYLTSVLREEGERALLQKVTCFEVRMHPVVIDYRLTREVSFLRYLLAEPEWEPHEVHLPYPRPKSTQAYREAFGNARLCFNASIMGIWFSSGLLDRPLPQADAQRCALLTQQAEQMLEQQLAPAESPLSVQLENLLMTLLPKGRPNSQEVARKLGVSERTLRRRLESEGESYQAVLDRAREKLAKLYLEDPAFGTQDLARQLGFESGSALRRAYERWTGGTLRGDRVRRTAPRVHSERAAAGH